MDSSAIKLRCEEILKEFYNRDHGCTPIPAECSIYVAAYLDALHKCIELLNNTDTETYMFGGETHDSGPLTLLSAVDAIKTHMEEVNNG